MALRPTGPRLVRGFLSLEPWQRRMAVVCLFLLPAVGVGIRVTRVAKLERLINWAYGGRSFGNDDAAILAYGTELAYVVRAVAHHGVFRAKCLEQSFALWCLLRRRGMPVEIRFGARKSSGTFEAHAWVEYKGTILDRQDELVSQFARFPRPLVKATDVQ